MALKQTTVMVDEDDLRVIKEAAAREGCLGIGRAAETWAIIDM